jgi:hypothetical protein
MTVDRMMACFMQASLRDRAASSGTPASEELAGHFTPAHSEQFKSFSLWKSEHATAETYLSRGCHLKARETSSPHSQDLPYAIYVVIMATDTVRHIP